MIHSGEPLRKTHLTCDYIDCNKALDVQYCFRDKATASAEEVCEAISDMAWSLEWVGGDPADLIEDLAKPVENRRKTYCASHSTRCIACDATGNYGSCAECDNRGYLEAAYAKGQAVFFLEVRPPQFATVQAVLPDRKYAVVTTDGQSWTDIPATDLTPAPKQLSPEEVLDRWLQRL